MKEVVEGLEKRINVRLCSPSERRDNTSCRLTKVVTEVGYA